MTQIIEYDPLPGMQEEFLKCSATECLFGGEAGNGKTMMLLLAATRYIHEPDYRACFFRLSFPDLQQMLQEAQKIYVGAKFNQQKHMFTFPSGATIYFKHLKNMKEAFSFQSQQFDFLGFDELTHYPQPVYEYLISRLRGINPNIVRMIRSGCNPSGPHVGWVKERFPDVLEPIKVGHFKNVKGKSVKFDKKEPGTMSRAFIPAYRSENTILMAADPDYENRLDQLGEKERAALKHGKWITTDEPNQLISYAAWEHAISGDVKYVDDGKYTVAGDFATYQGSDKSVEILGRGNRPYRCRSWDKTKTPHFALILAETARSVDSTLERVMIGVDSIGPGTGVADELEEHHKMAAILNRCNHKDEIYDEKFKGDIKFDNLRSQMNWCFKVAMDNGEVDLSEFTKPQEGTDSGYFDEFKTLQLEAMAHTYRVYNGKLIVISKEELKKADNLGHSPDFWDTLVIWWWVHTMHSPDVPQTREEELRHIDKYTEKMYKMENKVDGEFDDDYDYEEYDEEFDEFDEDYDD